MSDPTPDVLDYLESDHAAALDRLCDFLRIPSVSTDPAFATHCESAARWVERQLHDCGLVTEFHTRAGQHPIVVGRYDDAGPDAPRILFYGHYDVQPPDPLDLWTTPPFDPTIRDGKLFARGASDDKGQVMCFIEAVRAWKNVTGKPPVNLTLIIEGEEESSSIFLDQFIPEHKPDLAADVAVVSDTSMWEPGRPAICYGLRGLVYFDVKLHGPGRDLHSGVYGGTVPNPATELVHVLGQLLDERHHVTIPGFYDDVKAPTDDERARWNTLGFDEKKYAASVGLDTLHGEAGYSTLERRWARPSCDINGLYGGYMGKGAKTVIPSFAGAKVSFRLAPDQDPEKIAGLFRGWLMSRTPPGCHWKIEEFGGARPVVVPTESTALSAAKRAVEIGCGVPPVLIREGATIPVVATFKSELGLDTLLIGFGLNDDNLHSPNEKFDLENFRMGCRTHAALLSEMAKK